MSSELAWANILIDTIMLQKNSPPKESNVLDSIRYSNSYFLFSILCILLSNITVESLCCIFFLLLSFLPA